MVTKKTTAAKTTKTATAKKETPKTTATKASPKTTKKAITDEDIAIRAYEIHVETGCENELENWIQAEKELKGKKK
jgi:hypothetical protein